MKILNYFYIDLHKQLVGVLTLVYSTEWNYIILKAHRIFMDKLSVLQKCFVNFLPCREGLLIIRLLKRAL